MREVTLANVEKLSQYAVSESGFGRYSDKLKKNHLVATKTPGTEILRPQAYTGDHGLMITRMADRGFPLEDAGFRVPPDPVANELPDWMRALGSANLGGLLVRSPYTVEYMLAHPENLPNNVPKVLGEAGLLEQENGKPIIHHYSLDGVTPYGDPAGMLF